MSLGMDILAAILLVCYGFVFVSVLVSATHKFVLFLLFITRPEEGSAPDPDSKEEKARELPKVTVQLPLYNEAGVAERLLTAVSAMDYPREKLEIQVLDDSTDRTSEIVANFLTFKNPRGVKIEHIRRPSREGFKGGALNNGLRQASGSLIAVFDAEFIPPPEFLRNTVPVFADEQVAFVQARWEHVGRSRSWLAAVQATFLDSQFELEHPLRSRSALLLQFNGSAGVWRKRAIEANGGWTQSADYSAEDLDLSYKAQIAGWTGRYLGRVATPAELPASMHDFRTQQEKWSHLGSNSSRLLFPLVWESDLPALVKAETTLQLLSRWTNVPVILLFLLWIPAVLAGRRFEYESLWSWFVIAASLAYLLIFPYFWVSQRRSGAGIWRKLWILLLTTACGVGLTLIRAKGNALSLFGRPCAFPTTPKSAGETPEASISSQRRRFEIYGPEVAASFLLGCLAWVAVVVDAVHAIPFLCHAALGFLFVGVGAASRNGECT